jgi:hypothetical protein
MAKAPLVWLAQKVKRQGEHTTALVEMLANGAAYEAVGGAPNFDQFLDFPTKLYPRSRDRTFNTAPRPIRNRRQDVSWRAVIDYPNKLEKDLDLRGVERDSNPGSESKGTVP